MMMKKHIPNIITLFNLTCGCFAILLSTGGYLKEAAVMVLLASVFDFFDGFAARLLHVKSNIGKELDSLVDMVSFGVSPAIIIYCLFLETGICSNAIYGISFIPAILSILYPCFVALRLAKFNLDARQTDIFYGLPSPAAAFVLISFVFFPQNPYSFFIYAAVILLLCILMVINVPLLSLKFKDAKLRNNIFRYILIFCAIVLAVLLQFRSIPFIIFVYLILSFIGNIIAKNNES
ncbi:MAG: CDP-diacylglycerol--serine O-phosphatidyltransferase [Bacteroidales bacterium]|jgi:CDP-diacylglycerol--serine O-phosphatidyltransferase|nr:CDP-diacylglycerol--serine O-phosphatidyltransferase [Bacteroidales bacterium]